MMQARKGRTEPSIHLTKRNKFSLHYRRCKSQTWEVHEMLNSFKKTLNPCRGVRIFTPWQHI
jgi:hypothetical protein